MATVKAQRVVELEELRSRLHEAEETLAAIRSGEVDALVVCGPAGEQVFSLKGAEQPYRIFVEQMEEGAVTLTPDGMILYCNRRFAGMVGMPLQKVIGATFRRFVGGSDQTELEDILVSPDGRKAEFPLIAEDGSAIPVLLSFNQLPMDDMKAICLVVTDLTERKKRRELTDALQKLREAQERLQQQNEQLNQSRREAERANEAKDNFLAALSHELRTPLTPVLMMAAMLEQDDTMPQHLRADIEMIRRNIEMEARLIDDLLDLTRIVRGKVELKRGQADLCALLQSALAICRGEIDQKGLVIEQEMFAANPVVDGDAVRLQQILWNLLRNAVKFTPAGGRIAIRCEEQEGIIRVCVSDSGIGFEPEVMERIFLPFEQADVRITRQFGGLGLGLAISRRLAEMHGGTITAHSDGSGRGATFSLVLPAVDGAAVSAATEASTRCGEQPERLRILLVEDHQDTRDGTARLLRGQHMVRAVATMAEALEAAAQEPFDLVISDLGLPDGSGLDLMQRLRRQSSINGICLSGYGKEDDRARSREAGFAQHLVKPINLDQLHTAIQQTVHGRSFSETG